MASASAVTLRPSWVYLCDLAHYLHVIDAIFVHDVIAIVRFVCNCIGVALDDLVYICTKIARQMDSNGLSKVFDAAETATSAIEEARPLLENAVKLVDEVCSCSRSLCNTRVHTQTDFTIQPGYWSGQS